MRGRYGEGRIFPRYSDGRFLTWTFAEENFDVLPRAFDLKVYGYEMDLVPGGGFRECFRQGGCPFNRSPGVMWTDWRAPEGMEWASTPASLRVADLGAGWDSTIIFTFELFHDNLTYPVERNMPSSTWP